jgi:hypothetical protein
LLTNNNNIKGMINDINGMINDINGMINDIRMDYYSYAKWISIFACTVGFTYFVYKIYNNKITVYNKDAFNLDESSEPKIEIVHITEESSELENYISNWLEHLYLDSGTTSDTDSDSSNSFIKIENEIENEIDNALDIRKCPETLKKGRHDKVYVEYKLNNDKYAICITSEISKNPQINEDDGSGTGIMIPGYGLKRKILSAYLKSENIETVDVTRLLREFQGPNVDFYQNVGGVSKKWSDILYPYDLEDWDTLEINDLFGDNTVLSTKELDTIEWNSNYSI